MNRSEVYTILEEYFKIYRIVFRKKTYKKLYVPTHNPVGLYINNKIYIAGVNHCFICNDELVIRDKLAMMQVNIKYRDITSLEIYEHDEE